MFDRLSFSCACIAALVGFASAQDIPTSLTCTPNAKAQRDYGFTEKQWSGVIPPDAAIVFGISTVNQSQTGGPLRDKVFSSLNTSKYNLNRRIMPRSRGQRIKHDSQ